MTTDRELPPLPDVGDAMKTVTGSTDILGYGGVSLRAIINVLMRDYATAAVLAERERCARVCELADKSAHPSDLADAIRATPPEEKK